MFVVVLIAIVLGAVYCLPMIVAAYRKHHQRNAIAIINFFLGWTGLGWVIALAWAMTAVRQP